MWVIWAPAVIAFLMEHVESGEQAIAQVHRVLKPGEIFQFDTINYPFKSQLVFIWLLEDVLREIPQGIHNWQKFIRPQELAGWMSQVRFEAIETKGFNIFGKPVIENLSAYLHYKQTGKFRMKSGLNPRSCHPLRSKSSFLVGFRP